MCNELRRCRPGSLVILALDCRSFTRVSSPHFIWLDVGPISSHCVCAKVQVHQRAQHLAARRLCWIWLCPARKCAVCSHHSLGHSFCLLGPSIFDRAAFRVLSFRHAPISMDAFRDEGLTTWLRACLFSSCAHFSAWRYILAHSTWGEWAGPHPRCTGCGRTTRCWWTRSSRKRGQCHARSNQSAQQSLRIATWMPTAASGLLGREWRSNSASGSVAKHTWEQKQRGRVREIT